MHATLTVSRLDFCPAICPLTIFSLSVSDWDTGYFAPNLDCCVTRCELLMTRCRWLVYCVAVWPPHQCSDLVWWNSAEILINGRPSSTAQHSSQRLIEKFAGDYQDTKPDWVRTGLIISLVSMSYCHNLVFLVFKPNFSGDKTPWSEGWPGCVMCHYIQLWFLQFPFKFKLERF